MKKNKCLLIWLCLFAGKIAAAQFAIAGKVTDANHKSIPNVSVHLLNTNYGTVSNDQGKFVLTKVVSGLYIIHFSSTGYVDRNEEVTVGTNDLQIDASLKEVGKSLDEVVVTAQKKEELLQKLPLSITAISSEKVKEFRLWNSKDITAIVPNLYSAEPGDKRNITSVRGIASTSYDPAVATYIDAVNQFSLDTYISPLFDVERIEVLRGPQGTLYGRNAMGGVINIITRQPTNRTDVFAEASIASYGTQRYSAGIKTPVIKDKLFMGMAGLYEKSNGFYTNEFNNSNYDKQYSITGNYYIKYVANPKLVFTLNAKHNANRNNGPFPLVVGVEQAFSNPYKLNQNALTKIIDNTFNSSLSINYSGSGINLQSQTSYQSNYRYYTNPIDADFSPIDGITLDYNYGKNWNTVKVISEELKISNPTRSASKLKWTAGTYFFYQKSPSKIRTHFGDDGTLVGAPDNNFSLINTSKTDGFGIAFYGQGTYTITKKLDLTAGIRYDHEYKKLDIRGEYEKTPDPPFETRSDTFAHASFNAVTPKIGLAYHVNSDHHLFASYSRGFRAGGLTPLSSDPSLPALFPFKPEYSNNVEAGIKNKFFSDRLFLNISLFYTTVSNAQVPTLILPDAITITKNTGLLHSKGAEAELSATLLHGLEIFYNAGYTDAHYKNLKVSQNGGEIDLKGMRPVFTPKYTSILALQYGINLSKESPCKILVRGELKSIGKQYFDLSNTIPQSPYSLINTSLGLLGKKIQIMLWSRNLTGKKYIAYAYDFGGVHLGDPATYGITVTLKHMSK